MLDNISFAIEAGQKVCVMGESGSGKSSLLRVLTGAFKKFEGSILINQMPIGNYTLDSLRSQTGILLSQQDIFNGSIWENITMGNKAITPMQVGILVDKSGLSSLIQSLPNGYDTELDPTGKKLSGKVRQDILLLRALLGKSRLLLLEEPLLNLDGSFKKNIAEYILKEINATVIIATADVEIAKECDLVIYLQEGKIKAIGTWLAIANQIN